MTQVRHKLGRLVALLSIVALIILPALSASALTCDSDEVVWVHSTASEDGTYQWISTSGPNSQTWYNDDVGSHDFRTGRQSISWADTITDANSHSTSQYCVDANINRVDPSRSLVTASVTWP